MQHSNSILYFDHQYAQDRNWIDEYLNQTLSFNEGTDNFFEITIYEAFFANESFLKKTIKNFDPNLLENYLQENITKNPVKFCLALKQFFDNCNNTFSLIEAQRSIKGIVKYDGNYFDQVMNVLLDNGEFYSNDNITFFIDKNSILYTDKQNQIEKELEPYLIEGDYNDWIIDYLQETIGIENENGFFYEVSRDKLFFASEQYLQAYVDNFDSNSYYEHFNSKLNTNIYKVCLTIRNFILKSNKIDKKLISYEIAKINKGSSYFHDVCNYLIKNKLWVEHESYWMTTNDPIFNDIRNDEYWNLNKPILIQHSPINENYLNQTIKKEIIQKPKPKMNVLRNEGRSYTLELLNNESGWVDYTKLTVVFKNLSSKKLFQINNMKSANNHMVIDVNSNSEHVKNMTDNENFILFLGNILFYFINEDPHKLSTLGDYFLVGFNGN